MLCKLGHMTILKISKINRTQSQLFISNQYVHCKIIKKNNKKTLVPGNGLVTDVYSYKG